MYTRNHGLLSSIEIGGVDRKAGRYNIGCEDDITRQVQEHNVVVIVSAKKQKSKLKTLNKI